MSGRAALASAPLRRRSVRLSGTPKKSNYFESPHTSEDELATPVKKRGRPPKRANQQHESSEEQFESEEEDDDDLNEEEQQRPRKRGRPSARADGNRRTSLQKEESEEYVEDGADNNDEEEDESELDEDAPPKVTIMPLEKMRDTGGISYEDHKIHRNTLLFLGDLKKNNRREWLKSHDGEYRRALKDWQSFVETTTLSIIEIDETVPELPVKDVSFRIHRDIRFSKDPTPYKPHFSAAWSRTGRKGPYACYYIHCEPKSSFVGGGLWCPEKAHIDKLRRSIDRHPARWREALNNPHLKRVFFPGVKASAGPEKVVEAFLEKNKSNALKKKPADWNADHRDIKLLRLRNYTIGTKLDDDIFYADDAQAKISDVIQAMSGFVSFLNSIVMPDATMDNLDDDSSEEDDAEDS